MKRLFLLLFVAAGILAAQKPTAKDYYYKSGNLEIDPFDHVISWEGTPVPLDENGKPPKDVVGIPMKKYVLNLDDFTLSVDGKKKLMDPMRIDQVRRLLDDAILPTLYGLAIRSEKGEGVPVDEDGKPKTKPQPPRSVPVRAAPVVGKATRK